jgi:lysozyme
MRVDTAGRRFLKEREGFFSFAYDDFDGRPWSSSSKRGTKTIGYGTTESDVKPLPDTITRAGADRLLIRGLDHSYEPNVEALFREGGPLHGKFTQGRFNALVSFCYNLGAAAVPRKIDGRWTITPGFETIGRAIMAGDIDAIANALPLYRNRGSVWEQGLLRRRLAEAAMIRRRPQRWEGFTTQERRWCEELDRLRTSPTRANLARRRELSRNLTVQRKRVWRAAQHDRDWWSHRRRARYDAMLRRSR